MDAKKVQDSITAALRSAGREGRVQLAAAMAWVLVGRRPRAVERGLLRDAVRLTGFRRAAQGLVLRGLLGSAERAAVTTVLAPALEGLFTVAVSADDTGIGLEVLGTGVWEPEVCAFLTRTLKPGMTVADVGANVGFHALHAAVLVGEEGRVIAVEPDRRNAALLRLAVRLNHGLAPVSVVEAALADADGELLLSDLGNAANSGARFTHPDRAVLEALVHGAEPRFRKVPAMRWDSRFGETRLDFVKLDVEGYEPRVVAGMEKALRRDRPVVLSELAPANLRQLGGVEPAAYLGWFEERGYRIEVLLADGGTQPATADEAVARTAGGHHIEVVLRPC